MCGGRLVEIGVAVRGAEMQLKGSPMSGLLLVKQDQHFVLE
jgi:hypothetical protein